MTKSDFEANAKLVSVKYKAYCVECDWSSRWLLEYEDAEQEGEIHEQDEGDDHFTKIRRKTIHTN